MLSDLDSNLLKSSYKDLVMGPISSEQLSRVADYEKNSKNLQMKILLKESNSGK